MTKTRISLKLRHVIFLSFMIRFLLIPFFSDDFNYWAARVFTGFWIEGFNPWSVVYHDPTLYKINPWRYPPPYLSLMALAQFVGGYLENEIVFLYLIKIPLVIADIITVLFLFKILRILTRDEKKATKLTMLYAFNPLVIIVTSVWGTMEPIPIMFTILSLFFFLNASSTAEFATSAILLGWGAAFKLYPIFIAPAFIIKIKTLKRAILYGIFSALPLAAFSLPFLLWDLESYINVILMHNVGGTRPLFPIFYPGTERIIQIFYLLFVFVLFAIAFFRKVIIVSNILLSFLAIYFALGGNVANYSAWIVPFTILLLAEAKKPRSFWLLPFFPLPTIAYGLIYNGPYNAVEGATGFFYWTYHWLGQKVVIFRTGYFSQLATYFQISSYLLLANVAIILYFFYKIARFDHSFNIKKIDLARLGKKTKETSMLIKRNGALISILIVTIILSLLIFPQIIPSKPTKTFPKLDSSTFEFFDDFSSSLLDYQWDFKGNGSYSLHTDVVPSYILINSTRNSGEVAYIYRGQEDVWRGFSNSSYATIDLRFKFDNMGDGMQGVVIARTDGGWFGAIKEGTVVNFVYSDYESDRFEFVNRADNKWHELRINYNKTGRFIYFDRAFKGSYKTPKTFSFLFLGNSDSLKDMGGAVMIDWVHVTINDFPVTDSNRMYALQTSMVPFTILTLVSIGLSQVKFLKSPSKNR